LFLTCLPIAISLDSSSLCQTFTHVCRFFVRVLPKQIEVPGGSSSGVETLTGPIGFTRSTILSASVTGCVGFVTPTEVMDRWCRQGASMHAAGRKLLPTQSVTPMTWSCSKSSRKKLYLYLLACRLGPLRLQLLGEMRSLRESVRVCSKATFGPHHSQVDIRYCNEETS